MEISDILFRSKTCFCLAVSFMLATILSYTFVRVNYDVHPEEYFSNFAETLSKKDGREYSYALDSISSHKFNAHFNDKLKLQANNLTSNESINYDQIITQLMARIEQLENSMFTKVLSLEKHLNKEKIVYNLMRYTMTVPTDVRAAIQALEEEEALWIENYECSIEKHNSVWQPPPASGYSGRVDVNVTYHFDDPANYTGTVVQGWTPDKDRTTSKYVQPDVDTVLKDPLSCSLPINTSIDMVIIQHSAPGNFEKRMGNRVTWMRFTERFPNIKAIFVVGHPTIQKTEDELIIDDLKQKEIDLEFVKYGDVLQVDSYETYANNTLKSILATKYLLGLNWTSLNPNGQPPRFVFRSDDDVYINVPLVDQMVIKNKEFESKPDDPNYPPLLGGLHTNSPVIRVANMANKYAQKSNYEVPSYFCNDPYYHDFLSGAGYILPWWPISCMYQQSMQLPYFFIEDTFFTGWIADRCVAPKKHMYGFHLFLPNKNIPDFDNKNDFLIHYAETPYKRELHKVVVERYGYPESMFNILKKES